MIGYIMAIIANLVCMNNCSTIKQNDSANEKELLGKISNLHDNNQYNLALIELNKFIKRYPNTKNAYYYYLRAVNAEESFNSKSDNLRDITYLKIAYKNFSKLVNDFPDSEYTAEASTKLVFFRELLAEYEFNIAKYYIQIKEYIPSINRLEFIIENYPNPLIVPDALHLLAYIYDILEFKKEAKDARTRLEEEYPNYTHKYTLD